MTTEKSWTIFYKKTKQQKQKQKRKSTCVEAFSGNVSSCLFKM